VLSEGCFASITRSLATINLWGLFLFPFSLLLYHFPSFPVSSFPLFLFCPFALSSYTLVPFLIFSFSTLPLYHFSPFTSFLFSPFLPFVINEGGPYFRYFGPSRVRTQPLAAGCLGFLLVRVSMIRRLAYQTMVPLYNY
jgi:hypothetical protein